MDREVTIKFFGIAYGVIWSTGLILQIFFRRRLFRHHDAFCTDKGLRAGWANNSPAQSLRFVAFLLKGEYRVLADSVLTRLGDWLRVFLALIVVSIVLFGAYAGSPRRLAP